MDLRIIPTFYHKTTVGSDGITHTPDISKEYPAYEIEITEVYLVDNDSELLNCLLRDLDRLKETLLDIKKKREIDNKNNEFER